ncbi:MAG: hypothetical protein ACPGJS_10195 [Flammeovirgaceae bacterium]
MRRMIIFSMLVLMSIWVSDQAIAQKTTGCNPKACGPHDTKTSEAKVITNLRDDLGQLKVEMTDQKKFVFSTRITNTKTQKGKSDEESLLILALEIAQVENELRDKVKGVNWENMPHETLPANRAKQVAYLSHKVKSLKNVLIQQL